MIYLIEVRDVLIVVLGPLSKNTVMIGFFLTAGPGKKAMSTMLEFCWQQASTDPPYPKTICISF